MTYYVWFGSPMDRYFELTSFSLGTGAAQVAGGKPVKAQRRDLYIDMENSSSSDKLWVHCGSGTNFESLRIEVYGKSEEIPDLTYKFKNAVINHISETEEYKQLSLSCSFVGWKRF
jgi:type VI protein secretion system component Hcp